MKSAFLAITVLAGAGLVALESSGNANDNLPYILVASALGVSVG
jgi:hypothetical protein